MTMTFAIPFYSTPEYLDAAIRSVLAQSIIDWKLIVVDDRSPHKGIPEQIQSYNDPRITYHLNEKNLGQAGNWNRCLSLSETELVTILHADDMLQPHYAQLMLKAAEQIGDASAFFCNADIVDGAGKKIFSFVDWYKKLIVPNRGKTFVLEGEQGLCALIKGNFIMCPTLCYRRSKLKDVSFSCDFKCAPDLDFMSRHLIAGGRVVGLATVAFSYRRHLESGTEVFRRSMQQFEEEIRLYDLIAERCKEINWPQASKAARNKLIVKLRLIYFCLKDLASLRISASCKKFQFLIQLFFRPKEA